MTIFYTGSCLVCLAAISTRDSALCQGCRATWPVIANACPYCARETAQHPLPCGHCISHPKPWHRLECSGTFQGATAWLIKQLKYQGKLAAAPVLSDQLHHHLNHKDAARPQALVAMPLHWRRQWQRGFNQAQLLAAPLAKAWSIPLLTPLVHRTKSTPPLEGLDKKARMRTMKNVFRVAPLPVEHIAIVDDVLTTGASAGALAMALKKAGAKRVDLWVVAKTAQPL